MATSHISGVRIAGIACGVPESVRTVEDAARDFGPEAFKISESTGVRTRRIAPPGICTSDLCQAAAERLLDSLGWSRDSVGALLFVSQTPDFLLPATACCLQGRLKLSSACAALDISLGCSGYAYALWVASSLMNAGVRRLLILCGDTARKLSPEDRSVAMLFGDAGAATALEYDPSAGQVSFVLGTDGANYNHLIVPAGGFRQPYTPETSVREVYSDGNRRSLEELHMNGAEIFAFTLREVPPMCRAVLAEAGWESDSVDAFVFHQANRFMLQYLAKKMRIPAQKLPISIDEFGNTSSASIPLTMAQRLPELKDRKLRLLLAGFGVGLSFGAVTIECGPMVIPDLVYMDKPLTEPTQKSESAA